MTRKERERAARTRKKEDARATENAFLDAAGTLGGGYVAGRYLAGRDVGPVTANQAGALVGIGMLVAQVRSKKLRRNQVFRGATQTALGIGAVGASELGAQHRLQGGGPLSGLLGMLGGGGGGGG